MHLAWAAATGAFSAGGYPKSEVRGRSREDPMPERRWPRGLTPRPRSGAAAESARLRRHRNGREELPHVRGQGQQWRGATPHRRPGAAARRTYPTPEARGRSWEEQPHLQGAVAVRGAGGPREAIPWSMSEGTAVRRYPSSKVRSSGCALLEQP